MSYVSFADLNTHVLTVPPRYFRDSVAQKEELDMKMNRERASSMSKSSDENKAFSALLQFWSAAISHTGLLPAAPGSTNGGGKKNNKSADAGEGNSFAYYDSDSADQIFQITTQ